MTQRYFENEIQIRAFYEHKNFIGDPTFVNGSKFVKDVIKEGLCGCNICGEIYTDIDGIANHICPDIIQTDYT